MGLYINFLAIYHSEMASDIRKFLSNIFAILAKALINANSKLEFNHNDVVNNLRAESGFSRVHHPISFKKKQGLKIKFTPCSICVGVCLSRLNSNANL